MKEPVLRMRGIKKAFPGVQALKGVDFDLYEAEIHALLGENGAGKTTLVNILAGIVPKDEGEIFLWGTPVEFSSPVQAKRLGIAYVAQELSLVEQLTIKENIALGLEPTRGTFVKRIDWAELSRQVEELLEKLGFNLDLERRVFELSLAERQIVEIAKALFVRPRILVLDEPTSALTSEETERLFSILQALRQERCSIIYITHRLEEVFKIADRVTVLRDGAWVGTRTVSETNLHELFKMMTGKEFEGISYKRETYGQHLLEVEGLCTKILRNVSFALHKGEVLGVAGLAGSGKEELLETLFGLRAIAKGKILIEGNERMPSSPRQALSYGMCYVPEDRRSKGLFLSLDVLRNISASSFYRHARLGLISQAEEKKEVENVVNQLRIVTPSLKQIVAFLSGGNQQKVVLARAFKRGFRVLLMNDPTRGIDIGAKEEIYQVVNSLAKQGIGIIFVSSDLDELLRVSDRILVMYKGAVLGILDGANATKEKVIRYMFGKEGENDELS